MDYLIGDSNKMVLDKKMLERLEQIDNLTKEDREKVIYFIDMVIRDAKTRQAHS